MKKIFSALLLLVVALVLVSCGETEQGSAQTLYVYNWGEYISDGSEDSVNTNAEFEKYCKEKLGLDVKVNYSTYSSNEDLYAKLSSGAPHRGQCPSPAAFRWRLPSQSRDFFTSSSEATLWARSAP